MPYPVRKFDQLDAAGNIYFANQLRAVIRAAMEIAFPDLKIRDFVAVNTEVDNAAESWVYEMYTPYGLAKIIADYADDLPSADVKGEEVVGRIRGMATSFHYSIQEVRASQKAGKNLQVRKVSAARRVFEELVDRIGRVGSTIYNLKGLINHPNITEYTLANGAWSGNTAEEIIQDIQGLILAVTVTTYGKERPNLVLFPDVKFGVLQTKMLTDTQVSVLSWLRETYPDISFEPWYALTGAGASSADRMLALSRGPEVCELVIPQEFEELPPQEQNLKFKVPCHGRIGGIAMYRPLANAFADGI